MEEQYQVELVWNREFHFVTFGSPKGTIDEAIKAAREIQDSGDGARVKKTRVVNGDDKVVWAYGRKLSTPQDKKD